MSKWYPSLLICSLAAWPPLTDPCFLQLLPLLGGHLRVEAWISHSLIYALFSTGEEG